MCSNSLRSDELANAAGLLKEELRRLDSLILSCADAHRVEAGGALADVLTAKVMPSGHLSFTWPENAEAFDEACAAVDQFTGYRYFDSFGTPVPACRWRRRRWK